VDSVPWHEEALNRALEELAGFRIGEWENRETFSGKLTKDKLLLLGQQGRLDVQLIDDVVTAKKKYLSLVISECGRKDPGKLELFNNIVGKYRLGCVTNSNKAAAWEVLSTVGLDSYLECLVTGDDVRCHKPSSEGYVTAMITLKSYPEETVIVEDSFLGLQAARNTGAHVWAVSNSEEVTWSNLQSFLGAIR
jgi:beta-phosphoglucomutase-like phosphatase (HAD superfamily)